MAHAMHRHRRPPLKARKPDKPIVVSPKPTKMQWHPSEFDEMPAGMRGVFQLSDRLKMQETDIILPATAFDSRGFVSFEVPDLGTRFHKLVPPSYLIYIGGPKYNVWVAVAPDTPYVQYLYDPRVAGG